MKTKLLLCLALLFAALPLQAQTFSLSPLPGLQFLDTNGNPYAGASLCTYQTGTTTPLATFTDSTGGTPNANPVVLSSLGRAIVYLSSASTYRFSLKTGTVTSCIDGSGVNVWTQDGISTAQPTTISGTVGCLAKFNSLGSNVADSIACESGGTITITGNLTLTNALPIASGGTGQTTNPVGSIRFLEGATVVSGSPVNVTVNNNAAIQLPNAADSSINIWFDVPDDAVVTQALTLRIQYRPDAAPGSTNNKVKLKITCTVNNTAASQTAGDTITMANDTNQAVYSGTLNVCAASTYATGNLVQVVILRDTTVANNAAVGFDAEAISFTYTRKP